MYAGWENKSKFRCWKINGGDVEVRRWLNSKNAPSFTGTHIGVSVQMMDYDLEFGHTGYLSNHFNVCAGISYGYSMPIAKTLHLFFSIGVGYLGGLYKEYVPDYGCYVYQNTHKLHYVGPTKVGVSLTWQFLKNKHQKGGEQ